jgi:uncharacterized phage infection (PIP) family protein YhgE
MYDELRRIERKLDRILLHLGAIEEGEEVIMALADDLKAGIQALNDETNANAASLDAVQANIAQLAARIKNGMTDQEVADVKASLTGMSGLLTAESDRLKLLAQDPTNPVPPVPPALATARAKAGKP